jgi:hypothetical protein
MLTELRVGELGLTPYNWSDVVSAEQVAVFHYDVGSRCRRSPKGEYLTPQNDVVFIFDSLEEARQYGATKIAVEKSIGLELRTGTGQLLELCEDTQEADYYHGLPSAHRALMWSGVLLMAALVLTAMDWWTGWTSIIGVVFASKLVMMIVLKFADGLGGVLEHRKNSGVGAGTS